MVSAFIFCIETIALCLCDWCTLNNCKALIRSFDVVPTLPIIMSESSQRLSSLPSFLPPSLMQKKARSCII